MDLEDLFDRRVPLAIAAALVIQGSAVVWWASSRDSDLHFQQQRLDHMEQATFDTHATEEEMLQRLARIEERLNAENATLDLIEKHLMKDRR